MGKLLNLEIKLAKTIMKSKESHKITPVEEWENILNATEELIDKKKGIK